jgi:hypothetical protein
MDIMDINFDDVIQLLEADFQDFQNENKKSFITIVTLPLIEHRNNSSSLLDVFDCLHIQTIYRSINFNKINQDEQSVTSVKSTAIQSKEHLFLALRNIEIKKEYQKQGLCTKLIQYLLDFCHKHRINFWIDDVINDNLYQFLMKQSQTKWNELHYLDYIKPNIHYNDNLDGFETDNLVLRCFYAIFNEQS